MSRQWAVDSGQSGSKQYAESRAEITEPLTAYRLLNGIISFQVKTAVNSQSLRVKSLDHKLALKIRVHP